MGIFVKCQCGKIFDAEEATNIGTLWQPGALCPACGAENRPPANSSLDFDGVISRIVDDKYAAKKPKKSVDERVQQDEVLEYWVQKYIVANHKKLGFKELKGPFTSGPDFQVSLRGKWVHAEAEVLCDNYIQHKHHKNEKWAACKVLIVLSGKQPSPETRHLLPKTVIQIDKAHFTLWFRAAAKEYALAAQKDEPGKKASEKALLRLRVLASEIRKRLGVSRIPDETPEEDIFNELAFELVARRMRGAEFKLAEIRPEIDEFCEIVAGYVHDSEANMPVFYSRYCEKCDETLIIRASRIPGCADYESVRCPHCHTDLGEIRADWGSEIVAVKKGNYGNAEWQDPRTTRQFVGIHTNLD